MNSNPGVYILQSLKNCRYYIGSTNCLTRRLAEHNSKLVRATKYLVPLELMAFIKCETLSDARKSEYRLKNYKNRNVIEKVIVSNEFPWKYAGS